MVGTSFSNKYISGGGVGWLFPFSFQFFSCLAAVLAEMGFEF